MEIICVCLGVGLAGCLFAIWRLYDMIDGLIDAVSDVALEVSNKSEILERVDSFRETANGALERLVHTTRENREKVADACDRLKKLEDRFDDEVGETMMQRQRAEAAFADGLQAIMNFGGEVPHVNSPGGDKS